MANSAFTNGGATWGGIAGTLADQTDLSAALAAKLATVAVDGSSITGDGTPGNPLVSHSSGGGSIPQANFTMIS